MHAWRVEGSWQAGDDGPNEVELLVLTTGRSVEEVKLAAYRALLETVRDPADDPSADPAEGLKPRPLVLGLEAVEELRGRVVLSDSARRSIGY